MNGTALWSLVREYIQAEAEYKTRSHADGPGASTTKAAAEHVSRTETAAREAFETLLPSNV